MAVSPEHHCFQMTAAHVRWADCSLLLPVILRCCLSGACLLQPRIGEVAKRHLGGGMRFVRQS